MPTKSGWIKRRKRGSAFVEFVLASLVLIPVFFAVLDYSRIFYYGSIVQGAARAGTQYAVFQSPNHANTAAVQNAAAADAANIPAAQNFTASATYWCQCDGSALNSTIACTSSCGTGVSMYVYTQVNTQSTFATFFQYPFLPTSVTLSGKSIMRVQ